MERDKNPSLYLNYIQNSYPHAEKLNSKPFSFETECETALHMGMHKTQEVDFLIVWALLDAGFGKITEKFFTMFVGPQNMG